VSQGGAIINSFFCGVYVPDQARTKPQVFVALLHSVTAIAIIAQQPAVTIPK